MSYELTPQIIEELLQHHKEELAEALEQYNNKKAEDICPAVDVPCKPTIPGWKATVFRTPDDGEYYYGPGEDKVVRCEFGYRYFQFWIMVPDNVYGKPLDEVEIPEGYEPLLENGKRVYRVPYKDEWYLASRPHKVLREGHYGANVATWIDYGNRLILVKKQPTVKDVYGKELSELKAPDGYEFTGEFRSIRKGDIGLNSMAHSLASAYNADDPDSYRLMLRKKPTIESVYGKPLSELKPPKGYVFTGEFRVAQPGEPLMTDNLEVEFQSGSNVPVYAQTSFRTSPRLILRKAKRIVFEETDDKYIRTGDLYEWSNGLHYISSASYPRENGSNVRTLYRKVNETE